MIEKTHVAWQIEFGSLQEASAGLVTHEEADGCFKKITQLKMSYSSIFKYVAQHIIYLMFYHKAHKSTMTYCSKKPAAV